MITLINKARDFITPRALLQGLALGAFIWTLILSFLALRADFTLETLENTLDSQAVTLRGAWDTSYHGENSPFPETATHHDEQLPLHYQPQPPLPKGASPFEAYKKQGTVRNGHPVIALAVMDYGLSENLSREVLKALPDSVSLILSPYAPDIEKWQKNAHRGGYEIWLHIPTETYDFPYNDPGAQALMSRLSLTYNQARLGWLMAQADGYAGLAMQIDETFDHTRPMIQNLMKTIFGRGLGYFELEPYSTGFIETLALKTGSPYAQNTAFIEDTSQTLHDLEKEARDNGYAVGVLRPTPHNLKIVQKWLHTLEQKSLSLVPVSAVAQGLL